jgi:steroid 5-alpha reductase family enzyme
LQGIITSGPYAFLRHPAYVCKNISWWMIAVPWSMHDGAAMAFKRCVRLALINLVYYARAKTEEAHLLRDPAFVDYCNALSRRFGSTARVSLVTPEQQLQQQKGGESEEQQTLKASGEAREV